MQANGLGFINLANRPDFAKCRIRLKGFQGPAFSDHIKDVQMPLILEDFPTVQNSETVNGKKLVIDLG